MKKPERYSYSSIEAFKKCPFQFRLRYLDKIEKQDEGIEAFMGKRVHETLEFLYNEILGKRFPSLDQLMDKYQELWDSSWHSRVGVVYRKNGGLDYYRRLGMKCIAGYFRRYAPFDQPVQANELELIFFLDGNDHYKMKGIIDRLDHRGGGVYEIHDYKTGKRLLSQYNADRDEQLALYQVALMQHLPDVRQVTLIWHYLQHNTDVTSRRSGLQLEELISRVKNKIDEIRSHIESGRDFLPRESILCNWCYYWEECPVKSGSNPFLPSS
ncbi:MAG: RecB family exonuclease [Fidelibacterota bacterium]